MKNCNVIINGKNFFDQAIHSEIKWYKEIKKLPTGQGYTTESLLDFGYMKSLSL